ncbi:MAG TPA: DNA-formamidopyrimidine glycosylase family protein [Candidatus Limnocylindrales bacterium]|nr:DNA-formamidopyrimidine glycosylase family protein [Candidatus Limnocylindrales bacterium]
MPELPEVETGCLLVRRVAAGRRIVGVEAAPDPIVFERVPPERITRALLGRRVKAVRRHGKHFWLELDQRPWPIFHFGMAGGVHVPRRRSVRLVSHGEKGPGAAWPPRFTKLVLTFEDGGQLAVTDARRLGRIRLRMDPATEPPISLLGFDALRGLPSSAHFIGLVKVRGAPIKALLLDQSFSAGVGNWIADEVLYRARIDPRRRARTLSPAEARRLRLALRDVVATAVRVRADSDRFPRTWLFHYRWGKQMGALTARGEAIRHITVGGRTPAWVPAIQR